MIDTDPYREIAPFYDLEFDSFDDDVELYLGYAGMVGGPILELGSGTGRLLQPLAAAGYECHGVDSSPAMNRLARARFERVGIEDQVQLHERPMSELSCLLREQFRLIFAGINSFLHLTSRDEQLAVLSAVKGVLDRDGLLIIDIFNPSPETLNRMDDRYAYDATWNTANGERIERFSHRQLNSINQMITTRLFYDVIDRDGRVRRHTTSYDMRYIHRFEMEGLLSEAGFELEGVYGSYQLESVDEGAQQMIFVSHRAAAPGEK